MGKMGSSLHRAMAIKYIGLLINDSLWWNTQINKVIKKIKPMIGVLSRVKSLNSKKTRLNIYNSFIKPHIAYLSNTWEGAPNSHLKPLQRIQNKVVKIVYELEYLTSSYSPYTNIMDFTTRHNFE